MLIRTFKIISILWLVDSFELFAPGDVSIIDLMSLVNALYNP